MRRKYIAMLALIAILFANLASITGAQQAKVKTVEVTPATVEAEVGQQIKFTAVGKDEAGNATDQKVLVWFAGPFDLAGADTTGTVTLFDPGLVKVGAVIAGKVGYAIVNVKAASVKRVEIEALNAPLVVGGTSQLNATARTLNGDPRSEVTMKWSSSNPAVAI